MCFQHRVAEQFPVRHDGDVTSRNFRPKRQTFTGASMLLSIFYPFFFFHVLCFISLSLLCFKFIYPLHHFISFLLNTRYPSRKRLRGSVRMYKRYPYPKQLQTIRNTDSSNRRLRSCRAVVFGGVFYFSFYYSKISKDCMCMSSLSRADFALISRST